MTLKTRLSGSVAILAIAPLFMAASAVAQSTPQTENIEVTGSRIKNTDAESANPITVVSSEDIARSAATTVEEVLRKLPAADFTGAVTANSNNGGLGASQVSLRNLGPQRTLVLVNGQRYVQTDNQTTSVAVDLNNIPVSMIDHIEILRDGASSIYGADAIGGVVNIITKQHYNGVEVGGGVGMTSYGDGLKHNVYSTIGADFDRGNILVNVSEDHTDPILNASRSWAISEHPEADYNSYDGISSRVTGAVATINGSKYYFANGLSSGILASDAYTLGHQITPGVYAGGGLASGDIAIAGAGVYYDYLPHEDLTAGLDRTQLNFTAHYDIAPNVTAVLEGFYTNRQSTQLLAPEPWGSNVLTPQFPSGLYVAANYIDSSGNLVANPYNPTNQANAAALYGATNQNVYIYSRLLSGNRYYSDDIDTYRLRAGLEGTLLGKYDWQAGYIYGKSAATYRVSNEVNFYHLSQELGINPCGTEQGCSIGNFFGTNTLTQSQLNYLYYTNTDTSQITQQIAYGNIAGPVYQLPAGPLTMALGFEYRTDDMFDHPDSITASGDGAVYSEPTQGGYATASGYAELNAPLLSNLPFVKMLTADLSTRYDYNTVYGRALTYKAGLDYAVTDELRLRGSQSTGFRAPQVKELYAGKSQTNPSGTALDPCASGGQFYGSATCVASLAAVGATSSTVTQVNQLTAEIGGNTNLKPETSQEWTMGGVYQPKWAPGLSVTVDYYDVLVRNEISQYDAESLLLACYGNVKYLVSQAQACKLAGSRAVGTGDVGIIDTLNANIGDESTNGIDIAMNYQIATEKLGLPAWGMLSFNGQASYLLSDTVTSNGTTIQQAGTFNTSTDSAEPRWKALLNVTFAREGWSFGWTARYYGGAHNYDGTSACEYGTLSNCTGSTKGAEDYEGNEVAGVFYHDINVTYKFKNVNLSVGVDNLFDKDPPYVGGALNANSLGSAGYDYTGRFVYLKTSVKF
ncbi:TonB-dependent receptor [Aliidongia dinghuensis]|uniref:TonB-dependent receptor n=1 Tax=Aliidongia dinghuensis TaxID=1867774 RepID=A0A8J3E7A2_9PROT|nr:TonB-dependent receptor [Aliidongia dinghuensis]GGF50147.1 TonB-dependent receptor [Aliidongia dinghuensis]